MDFSQLPENPLNLTFGQIVDTKQLSRSNENDVFKFRIYYNRTKTRKGNTAKIFWNDLRLEPLGFYNFDNKVDIVYDYDNQQLFMYCNQYKGQPINHSNKKNPNTPSKYITAIKVIRNIGFDLPKNTTSVELNGDVYRVGEIVGIKLDVKEFTLSRDQILLQNDQSVQKIQEQEIATPKTLMEMISVTTIDMSKNVRKSKIPNLKDIQNIQSN